MIKQRINYNFIYFILLEFVLFQYYCFIIINLVIIVYYYNSNPLSSTHVLSTIKVNTEANI